MTVDENKKNARPDRNARAGGCKTDGLKKKKIEFSKFLVTWALVLTTICVAVSYCLALFDHDPVQDVTVSVATACIAIGVAYQAKSYGEKNSRNKYGVDMHGEKIQKDEDEGAVG